MRGTTNKCPSPINSCVMIKLALTTSFSVSISFTEGMNNHLPVVTLLGIIISILPIPVDNSSSSCGVTCTRGSYDGRSTNSHNHSMKNNDVPIMQSPNKFLKFLHISETPLGPGPREFPFIDSGGSVVELMQFDATVMRVQQVGVLVNLRVTNNTEG
jgi:hypothetical protein